MSIFFEIFADSVLQFWISGFMFDARRWPLPVPLGALAGSVVPILLLVMMLALLVALIRTQGD